MASIHDFTFFRSAPAGGETTIEMIEQAPDYNGLPVCGAPVYTPRNTVYRDGARSYMDYQGKGLGMHEPGLRSFRIVNRDPHLLYEASYLFLLSQIGAALDRDPRALRQGRAVLVLSPMGGAKSTLGDFVLRHPGVKVLSHDSPSAGGVHAFPLHLGLQAGSESGLPEQHRRFINRMEFGPRFLLNYGVVFLGSRTLARYCRMEPTSMTAGLRAIVLFQGIEFIIESSPWELLGQSRVGWSRLANCHRLLRRSQIRHCSLGRDIEKNAAAVEFAGRLSGR